MNVKKEYLGGKINVFCSDTHRFGTDAVLLEYFAGFGCKSTDCIMDFGCGCGIIPMLFARDFSDAKIYALDIQDEAIELVGRAIKENELKNRVTPLLCDLKQIDKSLFGKFDLVTMNPPYKRVGSGLMTDNDGLNIARFELKCNFDDIVKSAKKLLKTGGRFCVCNRPNRLCDMMTAMSNNGIEPKRLRMVSQRVNDAPMLVLLEGRLSSKPDIVIENELYLQNADGSYSDEYKRIYEKWEYDRKMI